MKQAYKYDYIKQQFQAAKTTNDRKYYVGMWITKTMRYLGTVADKQTAKKNQQFFRDMYTLSKSFCNKPLEGEEWCLDENWLKSFTVIAGEGNSNTKTMFRLLGWDYEKSVNPVSDETTTIQYYQWLDGDGEREIPFLLRSRGTFSTGSRWVQGNGLVRWELQFCNGDSVEIANDSHSIIREISKSVLLKNYRRVG